MNIAQHIIADKNHLFRLQRKILKCHTVHPGIRLAESVISGNNDLLKIHLLNTALYSDAESRRVKIVKISKYAHIDGVASVLDALAVRSKYFDEIGEQIENEE